MDRRSRGIGAASVPTAAPGSKRKPITRGAPGGAPTREDDRGDSAAAAAVPVVAPRPARADAARAAPPDRGTGGGPSPSTGGRKVAELNAAIAELKLTQDGLEKERDFYFGCAGSID